MSRPPQPTPWSCNGRQRSPKPLVRAARRALSPRTVTRPKRRLRRSARGSGDCPTTARHRVSSGMLNLSPAARTDSSG
eukprot:3542420-Prymnesium_polylepis.1